MQVVPVGPFQLNLSWNAPFALPGVDITFIVQAKDLNSGNISSSDKVESEYYIFEGSRPCDEYLFSVIAVNDAGSSGISREISGSLPACKFFVQQQHLQLSKPPILFPAYLQLRL